MYWTGYLLSFLLIHCFCCLPFSFPHEWKCQLRKGKFRIDVCIFYAYRKGTEVIFGRREFVNFVLLVHVLYIHVHSQCSCALPLASKLLHIAVTQNLVCYQTVQGEEGVEEVLASRAPLGTWWSAGILTEKRIAKEEHTQRGGGDVM